MVKKHEVTEPFFIWAGLSEDSKRAHALINSEVFNPINRRHVYFWSALTEILINTRNLLRHADDWGCDLGWCNQLRGDDSIKELIVRFRDALCHSELYKVKRQQHQMLWVKNVIVGKQTAHLSGDEFLTCEYDDDALILVGTGSLYLKRHIFRAFHELDAIRSSKDPLQRILEQSTPPPPAPPSCQE